MKTSSSLTAALLTFALAWTAPAQQYDPDRITNPQTSEHESHHTVAYGKDKVEAQFNDSLRVDGPTFLNSAHFFEYSGSNFNFYLSTGELAAPVPVQIPSRSFLKVVANFGSGEFSWSPIADVPVTISIPLGVRMSYVNTSAKTDSSGFSDNHIGSFGLNFGLSVSSLLETPETFRYLETVQLSYEYRITPAALTNAGVDISDVRMTRYNLSELRITLWSPFRLPFGIFSALSWEGQYLSRAGAAPSELIQSVVSSSDLDKLGSSRIWRLGLSF